MIIAIISIIVLVFIDQLSKALVVKHMNEGETIVIINKFLYFTSHRNTGAAWGILDGKFIFFTFITISALAIFAYMMKDFNLKTNLLYSISLLLMISGTLGNFIDRLFRKEVVDFLDVHIFNYTSFPIFNIADSYLTVGVILLALFVLFSDGDGSWLQNK